MTRDESTSPEAPETGPHPFQGPCPGAAPPPPRAGHGQKAGDWRGLALPGGQEAGTDLPRAPATIVPVSPSRTRAPAPLSGSMSGCSISPPPGRSRAKSGGLAGTGAARGAGGRDGPAPGRPQSHLDFISGHLGRPRNHLGPSFFFLAPGNPYAANEGWSIAGRDCYENRRLTTHTYMTEFAEARQGPPGKEMALQGPGGPSESRFMQQVGLLFTSYDMHVSSSSYDMHVSSSSYDMHV